jgi:hypothetical protein
MKNRRKQIEPPIPATEIDGKVHVIHLSGLTTTTDVLDRPFKSIFKVGWQFKICEWYRNPSTYPVRAGRKTSCLDVC